MFAGTSRFTGITSHAGVVATAIVLLTGAAILRGGAAAADSNDDNQFLALLADEGIPAVAGVPSLVDTAHKVCHELDTGMPANRVVDALVANAVSTDPTQRQIAPGPLARTEGRFVLAAVGAYCPYDKAKLAVLVTRPKAGWNEPTRRAADGIRPSGFEVHGAAPATLIGTVPPAGIADPNPPAIPEPPPLAHLQDTTAADRGTASTTAAAAATVAGASSTAACASATVAAASATAAAASSTVAAAASATVAAASSTVAAAASATVAAAASATVAAATRAAFATARAAFATDGAGVRQARTLSQPPSMGRLSAGSYAAAL